MFVTVYQHNCIGTQHNKMAQGKRTRLSRERESQSDWSARRAARSKRISPVSRLSAPNSTRNVPTFAVAVTVVSLRFTPRCRFTAPYGIPVEVSKAAPNIKSVPI